MKVNLILETFYSKSMTKSSKYKHHKSVKMAELFLKQFRDYKLDFINDFYGISLAENDYVKFNKFIEVMKLKTTGRTPSEISLKMCLSKRTIEKWIFHKSIPGIIQLAIYHKNIPKQQKGKWLSINSTRGGKLTGPWIAVPEKIIVYEDIDRIIDQIIPIDDSRNKCKIFGIDNLNVDRNLIFAYLLGVIIGDAGKVGVQRRNRTSRRIKLALTKKNITNERMGEFVCFCANSIGLKMHRIKDAAPGKKNVNPFYVWDSQSSSLVQWIFDICLGLKNNQTTTYDKVDMKWLMNTPKEFRTCFLQGLADSDGYVDFSSFQAGVISQPNTELIKNIFTSLGIKSSIKYYRGMVEAVIVSIEDAYKLPLFSPVVKSYRYSYMESLVKTNKLSWHMSKDLNDKIIELLNSGLDRTKLVKHLIENENIRVRPNAIRRIKQKMVIKK